MSKLFNEAENALRNGNITCVFSGDTDKYILVLYKGSCYEIEKELGNIEKVCKYKNSKPLYYDTQVNYKLNEVRQ